MADESTYKKYKEAYDNASRKYENEHIKRVVLKLNDRTDTDIIEFLSTVDNVNGFIKQLLREHMEKIEIDPDALESI